MCQRMKTLAAGCGITFKQFFIGAIEEQLRHCGGGYHSGNGRLLGRPFSAHYPNSATSTIVFAINSEEAFEGLKLKSSCDRWHQRLVHMAERQFVGRVQHLVEHLMDRCRRSSVEARFRGIRQSRYRNTYEEWLTQYLPIEAKYPTRRQGFALQRISSTEWKQAL